MPPERKRGAGRRAARDRLLLASLPHVVFDGWTAKAMRAGAAAAGMDAAACRRYFPGGAADAVAHFADWADRRMAAALAEHDLDALGLGARVALAVRLRIEALAPYREAVRRAVAFLALPPNVAGGLRALYRTVDAIWYAVGDRSADFSFYTKRALLAAVLSATLLYWLEDDSEDFAETWAFLDRRLADVLRITAWRRRAERLAARLPDPFRLLRATRPPSR